MRTYGLRSLGCALLAMAGIAARGDDLPPLNTPSTSEYFAGKLIWADLFTSDPSRASTFYTALFGWEAATLTRTGSSGKSHDYLVLSNQGRPVAGIALRPAKMQEDVHGRWVGYVSVPDVAQALSVATASGGRVLFAAKSVPLRGTQAVFIDPDGAEMGLMHSSSGDPAEYAPELGDWTWSELFARDPLKAGQFYKSVAGYEILPDTRSAKADTFVFVSGGYSRGSVSTVPNRPKARPVWLLFIRVASVKDTVARVAGLGGKVLSGPGSDPTDNWNAVVADPAGAPIGLVELEDPPAPKEAP